VPRSSLLLLAPLALIAGLAWLVLARDGGRGYPVVALDATKPRPQGDFYRSAVTEPASMNPFTTADTVAQQYVLRYTHDPLFDQDPRTGTLRPALAESFERSDDGLEFTFVLREGIRFSDGSPLERDDVEFTFAAARNAAVAPASTMTVMLRELAEAEFVPPRTLRLTSKEPHFAELHRVATYLQIMQKRFFVAEVAALAARRGLAAPTEPGEPRFGELLSEVALPGPGTGPYALETDAEGRPLWTHGSHLNLVYNAHSWRHAEQKFSWNLAGMQLRFLVGSATRFTALRNLDIDWMTFDRDFEVLLQRDTTLRTWFEPRTYDKPELGHYYVLWNHARTPLGDPRVRRALTMLFDRRTIVDELLGKKARVAVSWFKPGTPEYPTELEPWPYDPERARASLAEAGVTTPLRLSILCAAESELFLQILDLARDAFRAAGVELERPVLEFGAIMARLQSSDFDGVLLLKSHDTWIDPFSFFDGRGNLMHYANAESDRLLEAARRELDDGRRMALYQEWNRVFHDDQPVTLLAHPLVQVLLHRRFRGVEVGPLGLSPERWWVEPDERIVPSTDPRR
jgi:ABC-type transport system substrate-binding protein